MRTCYHAPVRKTHGKTAAIDTTNTSTFALNGCFKMAKEGLNSRFVRLSGQFNQHHIIEGSARILS